MLKKVIKYTDFDGVNREEEFYFNITKTELVTLQNSIDGGLYAKIQKIVSEQNGPELMKLFNKFVDLSYGEKSADGKYFKKSPEILDNFKSTNAYDVLMTELLNDEDGSKVLAFMKAIVPADMAQNITAEKIKEAAL